jgi:hypothetical protein
MSVKCHADELHPLLLQRLQLDPFGKDTHRRARLALTQRIPSDGPWLLVLQHVPQIEYLSRDELKHPNYVDGPYAPGDVLTFSPDFFNHHYFYPFPHSDQFIMISHKA